VRQRPRSLRGRLLALLVAGIGAVWAAIALASYIDARRHVGDLFDAQLVEFSAVLGALSAHEVYEVGPSISAPGDEHAHALSYQVYALDGVMLLASDEAPEAPLLAADGFGTPRVNGVAWRALRRTDREHALVIVVAHRMDERDELARDVALRQVIVLAAGLPLLAGVVWLAVSRGMRPLRRLAAEVGGRGPVRLDRVELEGVPAEVRPLVGSLNGLLGRVERSFEAERRFTGDAAHELRTPLAALRTQAEVALSTASEERRRRALEQVVAGVDRARDLVAQLLAMARLDAPQALEPHPLHVRDVIEAVVRELAPRARARDVELTAQVEGDAVVSGDADMLGMLLRNLVENAVRHAPRVQVSASADRGEAVVRVEDSGPGVPPDLHGRIFDRFFRVPGAPGGSGLGLSIVRRIAELHHGSVTADRSEGLGGLRVEVRLPLSKL